MNRLASMAHWFVQTAEQAEAVYWLVQPAWEEGKKKHSAEEPSTAEAAEPEGDTWAEAEWET